MRAVLASLLLLAPLAARADESKPADPLPYRTDFASTAAAGADRPWYQLRPSVFPPKGSEHRIEGELVAADFIRRRGQFRTTGSGQLVDFVLPPFGSVYFLGAEADLRDVPLGTHCTFFLYQDATGAFTQCANLRDDFTLAAADGLSYRLEEARPAEGKLLVSPHRAGDAPPADGQPVRIELPVTDKTRIWRGEGEIKLADLAVGDELLFNRVEAAAGVGPAIDIWVGTDVQHKATETQRKRHAAFLRRRGLPAWIDRVEGKQIVVTLLGDPADTAALMKEDNIVPTQYATEHRGVDVCVATTELRTYNPPVDRQRSEVQAFEPVPTDGFGSSGVRWTVTPRLLLEGFRPGRIVRIFAHPAWKVEDMDWGEKVFDEGPSYRNEVEEP
ncbi:MAG TPA: hypothetical protein VMF30_09240, partial [Pirellulales bacterium]|nr:hypothetical protein [Pirellulales bacterium]